MIAKNDADYRQFTDYLFDVAAGKFTAVHSRISGELSLKIIEAKNLPVLSAIGRICDPYVLTIIGQDQQRTVVIQDSLNPKWDQKLKFFVTSTNTEAIFLIMDGDSKASNHHIGRTRILLDEFSNKGIVNKTVPIEILNSNVKKLDPPPVLNISVSYTVKPYEESESSIFGEDLKVVLHREKTEVPNFVSTTIKLLRDTSLELDGIFRESGNQSEIAELRSKIDSGEKVDLSTASSMHTVTGLLKLYFRELPEPLLTFQLHDKFLSIAEKVSPNCEQEYISAVRTLIQELPKVNFVLLKELTVFLHEITQRSSKNRMTADNIGIVFGPNLLRSRSADAVTTMLKAPGLYALIVRNSSQLF
uniref:Rho-GAP domain-containing protein n=1 Tax=Arcella intermedia TaxID=1963864 RepID=A0A6B2L648_9EUKA